MCPDSEMILTPMGYHPVKFDQSFCTFPLRTSRAHRHNHFSQIVQPRVVGLCLLMPPKIAVERNDSWRIRRRVYLEMDEMGSRVSHQEVGVPEAVSGGICAARPHCICELHVSLVDM